MNLGRKIIMTGAILFVVSIICGIISTGLQNKYLPAITLGIFFLGAALAIIGVFIATRTKTPK
ncbi:hypothetical protein AMJ47_02925 [Parcubacteria bacterium DG_72]|nr:MAG: hypothetical protein AMJ47_02925 [Parcubacteria bacterium DG_72]